MTERAERLAQQFERANQEAIQTVERIPDDVWRARCAVEGWTVGVAAHHIAVNHSAVTSLTQALAKGNPPPVTWEMLHSINTEHERQHANCSKEETLELLRCDGERAASAVRELSDAELDRTGVIPFLGDQPVTTARFIEAILIGHIHMHLPGIQNAAAASSRASVGC